MDAKELRIGNYINLDRKTFEVDAIINTSQGFELYVKGNSDYDYSLYAQPIPLTEEWLVKFGKSKFDDGYGHYYRLHDELAFYLQYTSDGYFITDSDDVTISVQIKYVHQLQTLYFALTGEKLTC